VKYKQEFLSVKTHGEVLEYYRDATHHEFCASPDTAHYACGPGEKAWMRKTPSGPAIPTAAPAATDLASASVALMVNVPNPFNASTDIVYLIPPGDSGPRVQLRIYDISGRLVRTLVNAPVEGGRHLVRWDGTDHAGIPVASGVYLYQLRWKGQIATKRMLLVR
jgi:hypothetical protein